MIRTSRKATRLMTTGAITAMAAISGAVGLAPAPAAKAQPGDRCFYSHSIDGYRAVDDHTLLIRVGRDIYRAGLMSDCPGLTFRHALVLKTVTGSVCRAIDLDIGFTEHGITEKCPVQDLRRLSPAEVSLIPKRLLP